MIINSTEGSSENQILAAARMVGEYFCPNYGRYSPNWILIPALRELAKLKPGASLEGLFESFVAESRGRYSKHLSRYVAALSSAELVSAGPGSVSVFTGARRLSFAKLSAMVSFFAIRENPICKQKLNDLLFYCDFTNYCLYDHSISGARYLRRPSSPALDRYENILKTLFFAGVIKLGPGLNDGQLVAARNPDTDDLSLMELVTLHGVNAKFGKMTSAELRQYSRDDSLFRFTRQDDYISYEYARLLLDVPA